MLDQRLRRALAMVFAIGALLLGPSSLLVLYLSRTVLNGDAFATRLSNSLGDERVADFAAQRITDIVITQRRDLTALRPIIITVTRDLVASAAFRAMLKPAARKAHDALLSGTSEQVLLAVPDAAVLLKGALGTLSPNAAAKIPQRLTAMVESSNHPVAQGLLRGMHLLRDVRRYARGALIAALLLIAAWIVAAPDRRAAVLTAGAGIAATGLFLAMLVPLGRVIAAEAFANPLVRGAVTGVWVAFLGGLRQLGGLVGGVGLVLLAAATSTLQEIESSQLGLALWHTVARPQASVKAEALRVGGLSIAALLIILFPMEAVRAIALAAGVVTLGLGLQGFFRLTLPRLPGALLEGGELRVGPVVGRAFAVTSALLVLLGASGFLLHRGPTQAETTALSGTCNGAAQLCDRSIDQISFAGAHNAMGSADNPHWLFPNQDKGIPALLEQGVRAFMIDVHYGRKVGDGVKTDFDAEHSSASKYIEVLGQEGFQAAMRIRDRMTGPAGKLGLYLCHGFCELGAMPLDSALENIATFMAENPNEVVILDIEDYVSPDSIAKSFEESGLLDLVYQGPLGQKLPTLREIIASGGRVLVLGENDVGKVPWYHLAYSVMQETPYTFHKPEDFNCRPNRGAATNPMLLINHWIESTPAPKPSNAEIVNSLDFLLQRARRCARERGQVANVIAVDFAGTGDVVEAARVLNGLEPKQPAATP